MVECNAFIPTNIDPRATHICAPQGARARLAYYSARYGWVHALASYLGRKSPRLWVCIGPFVTRRHLQKWLASPKPHVLNLGGGNVLSERWLTADITPRADVFMDLTKPLPLPDATLDGVYSEEVIEHLDRQTGLKMLAECFRVLKPGSTLRLTTPSLDYFAKHALSHPAAVQEMNNIFYCHGHKFIYSEVALREALVQTGFTNIRRSSYRDGQSRYGMFDSHPARFAFAPPEWSQYWEAEKSLKACCLP